MNARSHRLPVVLVHGWPVTEAHWRHLMPLLDGAGFTPVPITLPGLGTRPERDQSFRKADLARWLRGEIARRGISQFALIGHDWGATVAVHLAAEMGPAVIALVIEEEILPGIDVEVPVPGCEHYPTWHGAFNRAVGLGEHLLPGREAIYFGAFLEQSAGPDMLDPAVTRSYVDAYSARGVLNASLSYYRTRDADLGDTQALTAEPIGAPVLAIGGRFAFGTAVADGMRPIARDVTGLVLEDSGHYPLEQEPEAAGRAVVRFLLRHAPASVGQE
ncbi:alpha/beta fold hydrolase [Microbacterium karelineae]|uniref:alpha/beta fold hydrolase n=1 Tax=Microbacterium karelineae TaxID=2654283 RepID=UPI0012EA1B9D|nr:alpha/beta hydrolase [Microbacterium karelineae]